MALANDMTRLLSKISNRLGLIPLEPHLPDFAKRDKWADIILTDTLVTFSRYFPNKFKINIDESNCYKRMDERGVTWYYIKDEILNGAKLLGVMDIDWTDNSSCNSSLGTGTVGNYFYPSFGCPAATFESILSLQNAADFNSLYNRGIVIDFEYPNRFSLKGLGNTNYDLNTFTVVLLVEHCSLSTISPTMQEIFESLAISDVANYLYQNLKYFDGLETVYVNIDLKLNELNDAANKRENVIEEIKNSYVSTANANIPYIWTI